jgi:hypothetical protein
MLFQFDFVYFFMNLDLFILGRLIITVLLDGMVNIIDFC